MKILRGLALGTALLLTAVGCSSESYDVILRGGFLLDGSGTPQRVGDVAFRDGLIAAVGELGGATAPMDVDATGHFVAPGFIDVHSHAGPGLASEGLSHAEPLLAQGLTTVVVNPDGGGPVDLRAQRIALEEHGLGVNVAQLVPHGSIRRETLGLEDRAPTEAELDLMRDRVRAGMSAGAWGLSSGTFYTPGSYAENLELVELSKVVAEFDGLYTSHIRDESNYTIGLVAAVDEVIEVGREAGVTAVVTHIKALGPPAWGTSTTVIEHIEAARSAGLSIYADQYPYPASATGLGAALLPRWSQVGGSDSLVARLDRPRSAARIREAMVENLARRGGADRIQFRSFAPDPSIEGQLLSDVADASGESAIDAALALIRRGGASIVSFNMHEDDIHAFMSQPWTMTASDGGLVEFGATVPHPRSYGTFPRKIARYALEDGIVSLEGAIRSMTSLPAEVMGMDDRGRLEVGAVADVVVFSSEFVDHATFTDPHQLSTGVAYLFIGGESAIADSEFTGARVGRVLTKPPAG